jgi:hypothetical protein
VTPFSVTIDDVAWAWTVAAVATAAIQIGVNSNFFIYTSSVVGLPDQ